MWQEQIKNSFNVEGVEVFDTGDEYIFFAKNDKGEEIEHHMSKQKKFPLEKVAVSEWPDLDTALKAAVLFPNLPMKQALEELKKVQKNK